MSRERFFQVTLTLAVLSLPHLAQAQATRTWISGVGDDVNPCSRTAPCKTFAGAISKTAIGGEMNAIDPGGFGTVTIAKAMTIDGAPGMSSILAAGTTGIVINAPGATVIVRNIEINGAATGINGIRIVSAGEVRLENLNIYGFSQRGITDERTSGRLFVSNSVISNNAQSGIVAAPASTSTLFVRVDHVRLDSNGNSGIAVSQGVRAMVSNSLASGNTNFGFYADGVGGVSELNLEACVATTNGTGVTSQPGSIVRLSNSTLTANTTGLLTAAGGSTLSYTNNRIIGNTAGNGPPTGTIFLQ